MKTIPVTKIYKHHKFTHRRTKLAWEESCSPPGDFAFILVVWEPTPQATGQALLPSSSQKKDAPQYTTGDVLPCSTQVQAFKWTLSQCAASLALLSDRAVSLPQGLLTSGTTESLLLWGEKWCIRCQRWSARCKAQQNAPDAHCLTI